VVLNPVSDVFGNHFRFEKRLTRDTLVPNGNSRSCVLTLLIPGYQILLVTYDTVEKTMLQLLVRTAIY